MSQDRYLHRFGAIEVLKTTNQNVSTGLFLKRQHLFGERFFLVRHRLVNSLGRKLKKVIKYTFRIRNRVVLSGESLPLPSPVTLRMYWAAIRKCKSVHPRTKPRLQMTYLRLSAKMSIRKEIFHELD